MLAAAGALCTGIDLAPHQLDRANIRWGNLRLRLLCGDARTLLANTRATVDICLSIFRRLGTAHPDNCCP